jgi:hypothetical protein
LAAIPALSQLTVYPAVSAASNVVTYNDGNANGIGFYSGNQHTAVFTTYQGHLRENWWDGGAWSLGMDHGAPPFAPAVGSPGVAAFYDSKNILHLDVFVTGSDGNLYERMWTGSDWTWLFRGMPVGSNGLIASPSVIPYFGGADTAHFYVFAMGNSGHLYIYVEADWGGWYDQGAPPGITLSTYDTPSPTSDSLFWPYGQVYAFIRDTQGNLWANHWNGSGWSWDLHGTPSGTRVVSPASALTMGFAGIGFCEYGPCYNAITTTLAHVHASNGHLYLRYLDSSGWHWTDLGTPGPNVNTNTAPSVTGSYPTVDAFSVGADGALYRNHWDVSNPNTSTWDARGEPPFCFGGCPLATTPSAVSFNNWAIQTPNAIIPEPPGIQVFFGAVYADFWQPDYWYWQYFPQ